MIKLVSSDYSSLAKWFKGDSYRPKCCIEAETLVSREIVSNNLKVSSTFLTRSRRYIRFQISEFSLTMVI